MSRSGEPIALPVARRFTLAFLGLLAVGIAVAYGGGLGIGFYFDDLHGIVNNPAVRNLRNAPAVFADPYALWTRHDQPDLRPLLVVSYAVNYALSGLEPWSYHALNLLLHFVAATLVFVIVRDHLWWPAADRGPAGAARLPAAAAALFFAFAPINSESVNYVWARSALLCVTLYLGAFLAALRRRWVTASVLLALALLTKAIAFTLPVMLAIHHAVYRDRARYPTWGAQVSDWRRLVAPILLLGGLDVAYVAYRWLLLPPWTAEGRRVVGDSPWGYFVSQWPVLLHYVRQFLWPDGLSLDPAFPYSTSPLEPRALASLLILLLWTGLALLAWRRHPHVTFATAWFFVTLGPESSFVPLAQLVNDHRPYIASSLGLSVLLAWAVRQGAARLAPRLQQAGFVAACLLLCLPAVGFDRFRTWQWSDPVRIWEDAIAKSPDNANAWMFAGWWRAQRRDLAGARRDLERARALSPGYATVYVNLALLEAQEGHLEAALRAAQRAEALRPDDGRTHLCLGKVLERMGRIDESAAAYQRALEIDPGDRAAQDALAQLTAMRAGVDALEARGDPDAAVREFRKVLELDPDHYGATFELARALDRAGKPAQARLYWERVLYMATKGGDQRISAMARERLTRHP